MSDVLQWSFSPQRRRGPWPSHPPHFSLPAAMAAPTTSCTTTHLSCARGHAAPLLWMIVAANAGARPHAHLTQVHSACAMGAARLAHQKTTSRRGSGVRLRYSSPYVSLSPRIAGAYMCCAPFARTARLPAVVRDSLRRRNYDPAERCAPCPDSRLRRLQYHHAPSPSPPRRPCPPRLSWERSSHRSTPVPAALLRTTGGRRFVAFS
ncbi:hypothetical protein B0H16DRAFT_691481 [Mycena metata]|uniref:Uncharacterized protein n=1 Tax=Mycena metata TaxID=1033252 RepID=A0AAD7GUS1_9AGAR|nr:hypothetical protein B0H16DRAFT_691481 [Mycena metata]